VVLGVCDMTESWRDVKFKTLLELEKECTAGGVHGWADLVWLSNLRVWLRRCKYCGAIEIFRGNDTIYLDRSKNELFIFDFKDFTDSREEAVNLLNLALNEILQY